MKNSYKEIYYRSNRSHELTFETEPYSNSVAIRNLRNAVSELTRLVAKLTKTELERKKALGELDEK